MVTSFCDGLSLVNGIAECLGRRRLLTEFGTVGEIASRGVGQRIGLLRFDSRTRMTALGEVGQSRRDQLRKLIEERAGEDRGIFGIDAEYRQEIDEAVRVLEMEMDTEATLRSPHLDGPWRLIYTTLTILGSRRIKLGLASANGNRKGFVQLGELTQEITSAKAFNVVRFQALGGLFLSEGKLELACAYKPVGPRRVEVETESWSLNPEKLEQLLGKDRVKLLLRIFRPDGWLDVTYVDDTIRIGRDHKGELFVLERAL